MRFSFDFSLFRVISYFGLRGDNDRSKDRDDNGRKKHNEKSNATSDSNSNNLFSSSDFSHLRKPESGIRTVKITDFADEKAFALSELKEFLNVLEEYLMRRR